MIVKVELQTEVEVEFDENSENFKALFEAYKKDISNCDLEGFAEIIASEIVSKGYYETIEGIGSCKIDGDPINDVDHPINIKTNGNTTLSGHFIFETYPVIE